MTDITIGTCLLSFWIAAIVILEMLSIFGLLLMYINLLIYIMFILSLTLLIHVLIKYRSIIAILVGITIHITFYVLAIWAPVFESLEVRFLPHHLFVDIEGILTLNIRISELITPLAFTGLLVLLIRKLICSQLEVERHKGEEG
ncbi:hypothetical protein [Natranaerobius trueperi]|uniref:Uncharacterized protein n=1 Tax=Natranaerobius trueperi TaxID=759412 RepID=A0A226BV84_9FIRM|nr:hypothetical protein [Natranaerobius trueperi]OWZ82791.1 hypothetical protein CDO51_12135 [Natranaerobius trueperi]